MERRRFAKRIVNDKPMPRTASVTTISTIGDLIDHSFQMWKHCPNRECRRNFQIDLQKLAEKYGRDASYIKADTPIRIKCVVCGASCPDGVIIPPARAR